MYFYLEPKSGAIINDLNGKLIKFYTGIRDDFDHVANDLTQLSSQYANNRKAFDERMLSSGVSRVHDDNADLYYRMRDFYNEKHFNEACPYSYASVYYFINKTAYSGMIRYNSSGEYNVPYGRYKTLGIDCVTRNHSELLKSADIFNADYSSVFEMAQPNDFMFLDPPYDCVFSDYGNKAYRSDGFDEAAHRKLASDFLNLGCRALMVIGATPLIRELYGKFIVGEYDKNYSVNIRNRFKSSAVHLIVSNYGTIA